MTEPDEDVIDWSKPVAPQVVDIVARQRREIHTKTLYHPERVLLSRRVDAALAREWGLLERERFRAREQRVRFMLDLRVVLCDDCDIHVSEIPLKAEVS